MPATSAGMTSGSGEAAHPSESSGHTRIGAVGSIAAGHKEDYRTGTQLEVGECSSVGGCVMVRQTTGHVTEGAKAESTKAQRRAAADKIRKMLRTLKTSKKVIKQLDDEQAEYLERLRKHL